MQLRLTCNFRIATIKPGGTGRREKKENELMNNDLSNKVKQTLKEKVEPQLAEHFGGAEVTEITDDGVVYIKMTGACGQCPSAEEELSGSIKEALISECPEITDVKMDNTVSEDLLDFARQLLSKDK
jgi:Fe-S cluster biogenesis protein NfuA